jgi:hypothetical protein
MESSIPESGLGNLAQAARTKQLKTARGILFFVGVITILANGFFFSIAESAVNLEIDKEVEKVRRQNMEIDQTKVDEIRTTAIRTTQLVNGIGVLVGVVYLVFGFMIYKHPVPITVTALVLYIGCWAAYGVLDPSTLMHGWIIKLLIVAALFKAVQAALAYEQERKQSAAMSPLAEPV